MDEQVKSIPWRRVGDANASELGTLLTSRRGSLLMWVAAIGGFCIGSFALLVGTSLITDRYVVAGSVFVILGVSILGLAIFAARQVRRRIDFHEFGAALSQGGKPLVSIPYDQCERFRYVSERNHYKGLYLFTSLVVTLRAADGRLIRWIGVHKERLDWDLEWRWKSLPRRGKGIVGFDELDVVRMLIADAIADMWIDRLLNGEAIQCGPLMLSATDATPTRGRWKRQPIAFDEIDRMLWVNGRLKLFRRGEKKQFAQLKMNADNFWPGFRVLERLCQTAQG